MIVAERKPLDELKELLADYNKVLVVGCGTCVAICLTGGEKEAGILATELDMAFKMDDQSRTFDTDVCQRQCDMEFMEHLDAKVDDYDALLSMACGVGIQFLNDRFPEKVVLPGVNTTFIGANVDIGKWEEKCQLCGECVLGSTGGVCPMTRCAKRLLNGPCGGTRTDGTCEVSRDNPCAWVLIYERLKATDRLDQIKAIAQAKDHRTHQHPASRIHEAYLQRYTTDSAE